MSACSQKVVELRQLLATRLGSLESLESLSHEEIYSTGFAALDQIGLPKGALTEFVSSSVAGPGGGLLLYGLLHTLLKTGERVVLIDGSKAFAPQGLPQAELNRLLWIRCQDAWGVVKAADLAVRDGNMPLVILLLTLNPIKELRRIPASAWHRLQMLTKKSAVTLLAFTPEKIMSCARLRVAVGGMFPLDQLHVCRDDLFPALKIEVERRRLGRGA